MKDTDLATILRGLEAVVCADDGRHIIRVVRHLRVHAVDNGYLDQWFTAICERHGSKYSPRLPATMAWPAPTRWERVVDWWARWRRRWAL